MSAGRRVRAAFVGAGARGFSAHYPSVAKLRDDVQVAAVCELDPARRERGAEFFDLPDDHAYDDLDRMLDEVRPELVYAIMGPAFVRAVAERCLDAGAHVVVEKPPGRDLADVDALVESARRNDRQCMVCFQRRHAAVTQEALRRIHARGPLTMCVVEFHKDMVGRPAPPWGVSTLWEDVVHVVDLARYLCGGAVQAVHSYRDQLFADWPNCYNALVRFDNGATALITGNRSSGGRFLRAEAHGRGIGAYMDDFPRGVRFLADDAKEYETVRAADLAGSDEIHVQEGVVAMHRHFLDCIRGGQRATSHVEDARETMRLVDAIERGGL
ncbi:MAG TPA: Gfo/Idh/MocA family oxidoreductase [Chloroflexota bacterium]|nr:Gfo/Idh/MocA family oxidoreductase [Chloroflexota bacterium]